MRSIFCVIGTCLLALDLIAQPAADTAAARSAAATDIEYASRALAKGMPAASVDYFADDGVAFAPFAVNGKKYWASRKDFPGTLIWQPSFAAATRAADLAYTTGPWEMKKKGEEISLAYGHYVTVWKKQPGETWRMVLDVGIDHAQPIDSPPALQILPPDPTAGERPLEAAKRSLQKAMRDFVESARRNVGKALLAHASDDIRIYREQSFPAVGLDAARLMLSSDNGAVSREFGATKLSDSGDMCVSYGNYSGVGDRGIYVMIWRIDMNGDWKLALDLQKKVAPTPLH
jgi:ketosteroid isomerase-like protein